MAPQALLNRRIYAMLNTESNNEEQLFVYIYIYIYIERERERGFEVGKCT